ncbi:MAG: 16S rRNA (adenine(1518)-N(6)/adenine(1519)-N(6))-dimethyltransferase, partial [Pseudomonadota bacterium]
MNSPHSPSGPVFTAPAKKQLGQHFLADRHYID